MIENTIVPLIFKNDDNRLFFEFLINSQSASIEYRFDSERKIVLMKTQISKYLRVEDVGHALIERVMDHAQRMDYKIVPQCPLVMKFLKKNKRYLKLVTNDLPIRQISLSPDIVN